MGAGRPAPPPTRRRRSRRGSLAGGCSARSSFHATTSSFMYFPCFAPAKAGRRGAHDADGHGHRERFLSDKQIAISQVRVGCRKNATDMVGKPLPLQTLIRNSCFAWRRPLFNLTASLIANSHGVPWWNFSLPACSHRFPPQTVFAPRRAKSPRERTERQRDVALRHTRGDWRRILRRE